MTPEEELRLLRWELKMRDEGYAGPFPEELMLQKIRKEAYACKKNREK